MIELAESYWILCVWLTRIIIDYPTTFQMYHVELVYLDFRISLKSRIGFLLLAKCNSIFNFVWFLSPWLTFIFSFFLVFWNCKQFSKASGRIKEIISNLPVATEDDDIEEAATLEDETETANEGGQIKPDKSPAAETSKQESDPFGLDALIPSTAKKGEKSKGKKDATTKIKEEEETKRFLRSQREALITCLEIAARRYKTAW